MCASHRFSSLTHWSGSRVQARPENDRNKIQTPPAARSIKGSRWLFIPLLGLPKKGPGQGDPPREALPSAPLRNRIAAFILLVALCCKVNVPGATHEQLEQIARIGLEEYSKDLAAHRESALWPLPGMPGDTWRFFRLGGLSSTRPSPRGAAAPREPRTLGLRGGSSPGDG